MNDVESVRSSTEIAGARLLRVLRERRLACCYWKSSAGLGTALREKGKDLDLLAGADDWDRVIAALEELGYQRAVPAAADLPGAEHWIGFDEALGDLDHVHLHYELYAGRPPIYEWRLPWESYLLQHTERHPEWDATVLEPSLELVLLAVRAVLEPKHREADGIVEATRRDLRALHERADASRVRAHASALLGDDAWPTLVVPGYLTDPQGLRRLKHVVVRALTPSRRITPQAAAAAWSAHGLASVARGLRRRVPGTEPLRHGLRIPDRGLIVAVVGADGAGKTTLTEELARWLGEVFDVERLYLGRGDWISEAQQRGADAKWAVLERVGRQRPAPRGPVDDSGAAPRTGVPKERALQALRDASRVALARRKGADLARAARLRREGVVVITDRYPHPAMLELDGPAIRLAADDPAWRRALGALEAKAFERVGRVQPDVVLRLRIDPSTAHARKPDHRLEDITRKAHALECASHGAARVFDIDAQRPREDVLRDARRKIWEALWHTRSVETRTSR